MSVTRNRIDLLASLQRRPSLNLFPTENRMSPRALAALSADAVHRYPTSEGDDYFYGDTLGLADVYQLCVDLAAEFFGATHAFVPFLSGLHTMHSVLTALCHPGDRVLVMDQTCGGHYATATICQDYGYECAYIPFDRGTCLIDTEQLAVDVARCRPHMLYLDLSTLLRMPRTADIRAAVGPEPLICLDASHILGLLPALTGNRLPDGVTSVSGSTHKTMPGPQKGIFLTNDAAVAHAIAERLPFVVSSGHSNSVGALAITLQELMPHRVSYGRQVIANAVALAQQLDELGFTVPGSAFGYSETHQVWVVPPLQDHPTTWGKRLLVAGIRSTTTTLPAVARSGLRLGVQELTRVGMREPEMMAVAELLHRVLLKEESPHDVQRDVEELTHRFDTPMFIADPTPGRGT